MNSLFEMSGHEEFATALAELYQKADELEEAKTEYTSIIDGYTEGAVTPTEAKDAVYELAQEFNQMDEKLGEVRSYLRNNISAVSTEDEELTDEIFGMNKELGDELTERGFEVITRFPGSGYAESATENEIAYQTFTEEYGVPELQDDMTRGEQLIELVGRVDRKIERIEDEVAAHRREFLFENLDTTFSGAKLDAGEGYQRASINQDLERRKAAEIRENPRDVYLGGFEPGEGTESLEEARKQVRENPPRGKAENTGPTEEDIEENNESIRESLERIEEREDRGIY